MKATYTEQYQVLLGKREMYLLVAILLRYNAEFEATIEEAELITEFEEAFQGEVPRPPTPPTESIA